MIAIIAPCGMLNLYSGPTFVGKVDVGIATIKQPQISYPIPSTSKAMLPPSCASSIRRSSLLPTLHSAETSFDEEVHLLSPVYPLQHIHPVEEAALTAVAICVTFVIIV